MELKQIGLISTVQVAATDDVKVKKEKAASEERKDELQLSGEARELMQTKKNGRIEIMKSRVDSGYYFSDEVTAKTAEKIMKSL